MTAIYWLDFPISPTHLSLDAFNEGDSLWLSGSNFMWKTRMAGLQSGEDRMMIDLVVWAQLHQRSIYTHTDRQL